MQPRLIPLLILTFCSLLSHAQDISGTWIGNYQKTILTSNPEKLVVEIFVHSDSIVTGASHLFYKNSKYEHYKIKGIFHKRDSTISFTEDSTIAVKLSFMASNCLGNYLMKLNFTDTSLKLIGKWKDNSRSLFHCPTSTVWLEKRIIRIPIQNGTENKDLLDKKSDPKLERNSDIQSLIEISQYEKDSIKVEVYDNGIIDNDSVSIYFNDRLIIEKEMISLKPIVFYVFLDNQNPISKIKLAAESLGTIPPCTALMIITTKLKRYEVNLSSNFSANAMIEFFLKE